MMEILKHGSHLELLEPEWLRGEVVEALRATGRLYDYTSSSICLSDIIVVQTFAYKSEAINEAIT